MTVRQTRKEGGVVLLLILGFMAMFAVMVVTFIMMTTNMSESANSDVTSGRAAGGAHSGINPDADARGALRTLMIGTNDHASPIGPFSIGENLYGEASSANNDPFVFDCNGYDYLNNKAWVTIDPSTAQLTFRLQSPNRSYNESLARSLVHETGSVLTFDLVRPGYHGYHSDFWNQHVKGTSALICGKEMFREGDPYNPSDGDPYTVLYTLLPSAELKQFMALFSAAELGSYNDDPSQPTLLGLRINPPAFSGTGAGGFAASTRFDGEIGVDGTYSDHDIFRLPYALWGNAAAPDKVVYNASGVADTCIFDARTFYKHLSDSAYKPLSRSGGGLYPQYLTGSGGLWDLGPGENVSGFFPSPIRMNPSYTAPDTKTPFLAHLGEEFDGVPSFHRPYLLRELSDVISSSGSGVNENVDWHSVLRKLTPRPLPLDHWNFSGSNPVMSLAAICGGNIDGLSVAGARDRRTAAIAAIQTISARLGAVRGASGPAGPWDVDNDGDGTKESVWIPSGLPIRSASDGTPYATFYSYLVLDMDGRVNVNTAGNWDQMPCTDPDDGEYRYPFDYLANLGMLLPSVSGNLSPWFHVTAPGAWLDDKGRNLVNREQDPEPSSWAKEESLIPPLRFPSPARRGEGFGPSEVNLLDAMRRVLGGNDNAVAAAANILWNRSLTSSEGTVENVAWSMLNIPANWNTTGRKTFSQPGSYRYPTDAGSQEITDRDRHQLLWSFTDPLYRGDLNENTNANPTSFDFPWRGKTYIDQYNRPARDFPTFDFSGSSLRVYDPLGNDFLTGAPRMSENPYLLYPLGASAEDRPYTVRALETLLRMKDYNASSEDTSLVDALFDYVSDSGLRPFFRADAPMLENARQTLTTLSSDIPLPAQIFPIGPAEDGDGDVGIYQLIRRCVILEVYKELSRNRGAYQGTPTAAGYAIGAIEEAKDRCVLAAQKMYGNEGTLEEQEAKARQLTQSMKIRILYQDLSSIDLDSVLYDEENGGRENLKLTDGIGSGFYHDAIDQITDDLYAMLPEDIRAGRRLDLNALSREASWLGWKYNASDDHALGLPGDEKEAREIHNHSLVERMKFARGLYILLSALTWQERNATVVADFFIGEEVDVFDRIDESLQVSDYLESSLKSFLDAKFGADPDDEKEECMEQELFANRLAQWCVNVVDFSDPDATMTPFYFDPTPMDGWWEKTLYDRDDSNNDVNVVVAIKPTDYYPDVYDAFEAIFADPDCQVPADIVGNDNPIAIAGHFRDILGYVLDADGNEVSVYKTDATYAQHIASWLEGIISGKEADFGFRRVWGMERPDLLLTETLNFHDLGIADTQAESVDTNGHGKTVGETDPADRDPDYDQVRRPQGSTYLELYCAANPNIPQSPELYDFDEGLKLWKIDLSRMTPKIDGINSPYLDLEFPVWRVAISASRDPHNNAENETGEDDGRERKLRKKENSILERLKGDDAPLFSFQPRQFNGRYVTEATGSSTTYPATLNLSNPNIANDEVVDSKWRDIDVCVSNILGPVFAEKTTGSNLQRKLSEEIEIDRVVWMTRPMRPQTDPDKWEWVPVHAYPDAPRLFWRVFEPNYEVAANADDLRPEQTRAYLLPNQYFVIGPEDERSIGSYRRSSTVAPEGVPNDLGLSPAPTTVGYFGIPSPVSVILNDTHRSGGNVDEMTPVLNPYNRVIGRPDGTHEVEGSMRAATYFGLATGILSYKRGLNISEPLWTGQTDPDSVSSGLDYDPYRDTFLYKRRIPVQSVNFGGKNVEATMEFVPNSPTASAAIVPDIPFDQPKEWTNSSRLPSNSGSAKSSRSPIAEDQIFGLGTVPGIRSAFLQRVADPNLPYHPLLNPYLTVDWNMMDLTVFNGEIADVGETNTARSFFADGAENGIPSNVQIEKFIDTNNRLVVEETNTDVFAHVNQKYTENVSDVISNMIFSSRQWGNVNQSMFFPSPLHDFHRNPWARAVDLSADNVFGLETAVGTTEKDGDHEVLRRLYSNSHTFSDSLTGSVNGDPIHTAIVLPFAPRHTLGWYNDRGKLTSEDDVPKPLTTSFNWYDGLETDWVKHLNLSDWNATYSPYIGAPGTDSGKVKRFEHLIWNDAPMTNPLELALVPASAPARFGTEFIRAKDDDDFKLRLLGTVTNKGGRSLGSGTKAESLFGYNPNSPTDDTALVNSPYLNFFDSVDESVVRNDDGDWVTLLGQSLNLAKLFELVTLPSPVNGTREPRTYWNGTQFVQDYSWYEIPTGSQPHDRALSAPTLREPGKINLNTIPTTQHDKYDEYKPKFSPVWDALVGNNGRTISWKEFNNFRTNQDTHRTVPFQSPLSAPLDPPPLGGVSDAAAAVAATPADGSFFARRLNGTSIGAPLFDCAEGCPDPDRGNLRAAMDDMLRLSGLTTNRSNVFAVWLTVGYFKVERVNPGVNMPKFDPDGNELDLDANGSAIVRIAGTPSIFSDNYKYGPYYRAIYPDGYTYGEELGTGDSGDGLLGEGAQRSRAFYLIDRSVPFDFRRGRSLNWEKTILLEKKL